MMMSVMLRISLSMGRIKVESRAVYIWSQRAIVVIRRGPTPSLMRNLFLIGRRFSYLVG
jgi:hypothetical protein